MVFSTNTTTPVYGTTFDSPYNFLMQAMNDIYTQYTVNQGLSNPTLGIYPVYQNITYNIWLGAGIHYFFYCPQGYQNTDPIFVTSTQSSACFNLPLLIPSYPILDNHVINVAALDCALQKTTFQNMGTFGSAANFTKNCVNVKGGQQPQVRVGSQYAFNITQQATFSNILFTGIDSLATTSDGSTCNLDLYPQQKCNIVGNPIGNIVNTTNLQKVSQIPGCAYTCQMPLNSTQILNYTFQQGCNAQVQATYGYQGMGSCVGQPLDQNFFITSSYNLPYQNYAFYEKRHFVLFNLYAFDISTTSNTTIEPSLYINNCNFQYMFGMEALINIETTNYFITTNKDQTNALLNSQTTPNTLFLFGADDGVNIVITNSTFQNSYFCWGLIKYRKEPTQYIQYQQFQTSTSRFFNMTNYVQKKLATPAASNYIVLTNSLFQNLDYQNQMVALTQNVNLQINITGGFFFLESVVTNKGLILNLSGYQGNVTISNCQFQKNMINIPGLAYTPQYSSTYNFNWQVIQSMPQFYQSNQFYCLGALIPMIQPKQLIGVYIENYALIYLAQMYNSILTITSSTFRNNISLHGTVKTFGMQSVTLTGNTWQNNMAYFEGNAANIGGVTSNLTVTNNQFIDNMGIILTQGTLVIKNSNNVTLSMNNFDNNMVGQSGAALYAGNNTNLIILSNQFTNNGPALSLLESFFSPYYIYMLNKQRTVGFYDPYNTTLGNCTSELQFYQQCAPVTGGTIMLPNIVGVVSLSYLNTSSGATPQVLIDTNYFYSNNMMPILNAVQQSLNQASALVLFGQANLTIQNNQFRSHKGNYAQNMSIISPITYNSQPASYWQSSHAPVILLTTQQTVIQNNLFVDNANFQVNMQGGLVQFQSQVPSSSIQVSSWRRLQTAQVNFTSNCSFVNNTVQENVYLGNQIGGLVFANGAYMLIQQNIFQYNGAYGNGLGMTGIQSGRTLIMNNSFNNIYCGVGCLTFADSSYVNVTQNQITQLIGQAIVVSNSQVYLLNQLVSGTYASFITQSAQSFTNITNCQFIGCLGSTGAVLQSQDSSYRIAGSQFTGVGNFNISNTIIQGYQGTRAFSYYMNATAVNQLSNLTNVNGQIMIQNAVQPTQSFIMNCNFTNLTGNMATIANLVNSNLVFMNTANTLLLNNNANTTGQFSSLILAQNSQVILSGLNFVLNYAANGIISTISSTVLLNNCLFTRNLSLQGGICVSSQDQVVNITSSSFIQNTGASTSLITGLQTKINVLNGTFVNNLGDSCSIEFVNSNVTVTNSYFGGNMANLVTNGFIVISSQLVISNSTIENSVNPLVEAGFFTLMIEAQLILQNNTIIRNLKAQIYGVLSAQSSSLLTIRNNVTVSNCTGQTATFYIENSQLILINQSTFYNSPQMLFLVQQSLMVVQKSNFYNQGNGNIIQLTNSNFTMNNTQMHDTLDIYTNGIALQCSLCGFATITNSSFTNNTSASGSVMLDATNITIQNSIFANNTAIQTGGGLNIGVSTESLITVTGNTFTGNIAQNGAALAFGCAPYQCQSTVANNIFKNNTAQTMGGALQYFNQNFTNVYNNTFLGNKAPYGSILGSWPSNLSVLINGQQFSSSNQMNYNVSLNPIQIRPGSLVSLTGQLIDCEGRNFSPENTAIARLEFVNTTNIHNQVNGDSAVASLGQITFTGLSVQILPKNTGYAQLAFQGFTTFDNSVTFIQTPMQFLIVSQACTVGEAFTSQWQCIPCPQGFYLFNVLEEFHDCQACQAQATCYGGQNTSPNAGYWRTNVLSDQYIPCFYSEACLGGNVTQPMTICAEGYNGIVCSQCDVGYFKSVKFGCHLCPSVVWNVIILLACIAGITGVILYFFSSQMKNLAAGSRPVTYVYFKILVSHFQQMGLISNINFQWDAGTNMVMNILQFIAALPINAIFPTCLIQNVLGSNDSTVPEVTIPRIFYLKVAVCGVFPFLFFGVVTLVFYVKRTKDSNKSPTFLKDNVQATMIIFMFIFYPQIIQTMLQSLNCNNLLTASGDPAIRLMRDMNEICFQGYHLVVILLVSIPSIVIWMILCPYYLFKSFKDNDFIMMQIEKGDYTSQDAPKISSFMIKHGFLMSGFNQKDHQWELYLLYRKLALVFILVFLQVEETTIQGLILLVFLGGGMFLVYKYDNYYNPMKNGPDDKTPLKMHPLKQVELFSLLTQIITVYIGLFFTTAPGDTTAGIITVILVSLMQLAFLAFFYMKVRIEIVYWIIQKQYKGKFATFFLTVLCCVKDREKFQQIQNQINLVQRQAVLNKGVDVPLSESDLSSYIQSLNSQGNEETIYAEQTRQTIGNQNETRVVNVDEIELEFQDKPIIKSVRIQQQAENKQKPTSGMNTQKTKFDSDTGSKDNGKPGFTSSANSANAVMNQQERPSQKSGIINFFPEGESSSSEEDNQSMPSSSRIRPQQNFTYRQELEFEKEEIKQEVESLDSDLEDNTIKQITARRKGPVYENRGLDKSNNTFGRKNLESEHVESEFGDTIESERNNPEPRQTYQPGEILTTQQMNLLQMGRGASRRDSSDQANSDGRLNTYGSRLNSDGNRGTYVPNNLSQRGTFVSQLRFGNRNNVNRISEQSHVEDEEYSGNDNQSGSRPSQSQLSQSDYSRDTNPGEIVGKLFKKPNGAEVVGKAFQRQSAPAEVVGKLFQRPSKKD